MIPTQSFSLIVLFWVACQAFAEGPAMPQAPVTFNPEPTPLKSPSTGLIPAPPQAPIPPHVPSDLAVPGSQKLEPLAIEPSDIGQEGPRQELKLKPEVQVRTPSHDYQSLSYEKIKPYLKLIVEVDLDVYKKAPTLSMATNRSDFVVSGSQVFVKGTLDTKHKRYQLTNKFLIYRHPKTKQILGYGAPVSGEAKLIKETKPMLIEVMSCNEAIELTARVFPRSEYLLPDHLNIKPSQTESTGYIIAGTEGFDVGVHDVVTLSLGRLDKVAEGDVVNFYQSAGIMDSEQVKKLMGRDKLPLQKVGQALIYKVYDKFSHALIINSSQAIRTQAIVRAPQG